MTKAVSNRDICFIKASSLLCEHVDALSNDEIKLKKMYVSYV